MADVVNLEKKYYYYMCLFLFALKDKKDGIVKNNLFRYVYIYNVSIDYLGGDEPINDNILIDRELGVADITELTKALNKTRSDGFANIKGSIVKVNTSLIEKEVEKMKDKSDKVKEDLNVVMYFVNVVKQYDEEIILSVFFNEPNIENAISRNKKSITLNKNHLKTMLEEFEKASKNKNLEKYDVFVAWLDYVFEEYLEEKKVDGEK